MSQPDSLREDATLEQLQANYRSIDREPIDREPIDRDTPPARPHHTASVRTIEHRGHDIEITTTYTITVDGEPLTGHIGVDSDGRVHYHGLPQASFKSAVDMAKRVVDVIDSQSAIEGKGY